MNPPDIGGASKAASDNVAQAVSSGIDSAKDTLTSRKKGQTETSHGTTEPQAADIDAQKKAGVDWAGASREKGSSPLGTFLFIFLRLADVWFQYALIAHEVMPTLMSYLPIGLRTPSLPSQLLSLSQTRY